MAKVYDDWINKITKLREEMRQYDQVAATMRREETMQEDKILGELTYIKERINASSSILTDKRRTAFFFVVVPEEMIIKDTMKAATLFSQFNVPIGGYIVNRVIPTSLLGQSIPEYLKNRIQMQGRHLDEIRSTLGDQVLAYVPELERDVTGLPMIEKLAEIMYADHVVGVVNQGVHA
jgi:arsenite-transporting ATPase